MIEQHYGNDVPTGPIPVIPPQDEADAPAAAEPSAIPAQRSAPEESDLPEPPPTQRRRLWLLAVLVVLCVLAAVIIGLFGLPAV